MLYLLLAFAHAQSIDERVSSERGRPVAVVVTKGTWCPVCMNVMGRLQARSDELAGAFFGVVVGSRTEVDRAGRRLGVPLVPDPVGEWVGEHGFTRPGLNVPLPGVLFYDSCGRPAARLDGRRPGVPQDQLIAETLESLAAAGCGTATNS